MSTPVQPPFREICQNACTPKRQFSSPGPALLLGISLSAKKEVFKNLPLHGKENVETMTNVDPDVAHFRETVSSEKQRITDLCEEWDGLQNAIKSENRLPDAFMGEIRSTVGQGRLIMRERFQQFEGLIDNCDFGTSEKPVTCQDLQGFWEMIYYQVEDVNAKFDMLETCRSHNWDATVLRNTMPVTNVRTKPAKKAKLSKSASRKTENEEFAKKRAEARKRLAAAKAEMKRAQLQQEKEDKTEFKATVTFDAGFFKINSPMKSSPASLTEMLRSQTSHGAPLRKQVYLSNIAKSLSNTAASSFESCPDGAIFPKMKEDDMSRNLKSSPRMTLGSLTGETDCIVEILLNDDEDHDFVPPHMTTPVISSQKLLCLESQPFTNGNGPVKLFSNEEDTFFKENSFRTVGNIPPPIVYRDAASESSYNAERSEPYYMDKYEAETACMIVDDCENSFESACSSSNFCESQGDFSEGILTGMCQLSDHVQWKKDLETSSASKLIGDAEMKIRRASEILTGTPRSIFSCVDGSRKQLKKDRADFSTSITPKDGSTHLREQLQLVASQLNDIYAGLSSVNFREINQLKEMVKKQSSDIAQLKAENAEFEKALELEKSKVPASFTALNLMQHLFDIRGDPPPSDVLYRPHYYRVLAQVKMLHAELSSFQRLKPELADLKKLLEEKVKKLQRKSVSLDELSQRLDQREMVLNAGMEKDNKELLDSNITIEYLKLKLSSITTQLEAAEEKNVEHGSSLCSLRDELESVKTEKNFLQADVLQLNIENSNLSSKIESMKLNADDASKMHAEECARAEMLQSKVDQISEEVSIAFKEFSSNIERRDDALSLQQKLIDDLTDSNMKLKQESQCFKDRVETLEYVEDEMRSLQEQLVETERFLMHSQLGESQKVAKIGDLNTEINTLTEEIKKNKYEYGKLQEELDVVKVDTLFVVRQKEEELIHGSSGMSHILDVMEKLCAKLNKMVSIQQEQDGHERDIASTELVTSASQYHENATVVETCTNEHMRMDSEFHVDSSDEQLMVLESDKSSVLKDEASISWKVDKGAAILQSIIEACAAVHLQFRKEIEKLEFQKSVLQKQLTVTKEKLEGHKKDETELEVFMRKRINELMKKNEEKANKLLEKSHAMEMLSDQNMELTEYKLKYEELSNEFQLTRRGRQVKRRSSSASALKCVTNICL